MKNLRIIREARCMSQERLALLAGSTQGNVSEYERGLVKPDPKTWANLANALQVLEKDLIEGDWQEREFSANKLRSARKKAGLSQLALSLKADLDMSGIRYLETGRSKNPHPKTVEKLSAALGVKKEELYDKH